MQKLTGVLFCAAAIRSLRAAENIAGNNNKNVAEKQGAPAEEENEKEKYSEEKFEEMVKE